LNPIKRLAGQTAIYGLPSIIGRILNYFLVPLYTRVFTQGEYGTVSLMYSFVAVVFIVLTYGMETSFFRFFESEKKKKKVYSTGFLSIFFTTGIFLLLALLFSQNIANWIKYPNHNEYIIWFALILSLDTLSALPFARLRALNKPKRFATIKFINITINIGFNLFFILLCPFILKNYSEGFLYDFIGYVFNSEINLISYVFVSNLIASAVTIILLLPDILGIKLEFDKYLFRKMIFYAFPLLFAGLAGIMNETLGRILIRYLLPENIAEQQLGIYSACYKIAILMSLFIQAFRYAAEPFFFSQAKLKNAKNTYAEVMNYFVITVALIFLGTMLYIDIIIYFIGKDFREGAAVIPILLTANLFLGIYYNLSVWFKLTNKTKYGAFMAVFGMLITVLLNIYLIPLMGYVGSAWATFSCYALMMIISYFLGQKYYPIKYNLKRIFIYLSAAFVLYFFSRILNLQYLPVKLLLHTVFLFAFLGLVYFIEKPNLSLLRRK